MTTCMHTDTTQVDQYETQKGNRIKVLECIDCGRVFRLVNDQPSRNYPALSYLRFGVS